MNEKEKEIKFYYRQAKEGASFGDGWHYEVRLTNHNCTKANVAEFNLPSFNYLLKWDDLTPTQRFYMGVWDYEVRERNKLFKDNKFVGWFLGVLDREKEHAIEESAKVEKEEKVKKEETRICQMCGKEFPRYKNTRFCEECREKRKETKQKGNTKWSKGVEFTCERCGCKFLAHNPTAKFCAECRMLNNFDSIKKMKENEAYQANRNKTRKAKKVSKKALEVEAVKKSPVLEAAEQTPTTPARGESVPKNLKEWIRRDYITPFIELCRFSEMCRGEDEEYPYEELEEKFEEVIEKVSHMPKSVAEMVKMKKF